MMAVYGDDIIEKYLKSYLNPNYCDDLLFAINSLSSIGLDECGQTAEYLIKSSGDGDNEFIIEKIRDSVENGLTNAFAQFGVTIEFKDENIFEQTELLLFLVKWNSPEGYDPENIDIGKNIDELGTNSIDILIEFYVLVTGLDSALNIDWITDVNPDLIERISDSLKDEEPMDDHNPFIEESFLNPIRKLSQEDKDNPAIAYIREGGSLGLNFNELYISFIMGNEKKTLPNILVNTVLGYALISNIPRISFVDQLREELEGLLGSNTETMKLCDRLEIRYKELVTTP